LHFLVKGILVEEGKLTPEWMSQILVDSGILKEGLKVKRISKLVTMARTTLIKVVMESIADVKKIMEGKKNLKNSEKYKGVFLFPDIAPEKRMQWRRYQNNSSIYKEHLNFQPNFHQIGVR